jgi:hypothetical protein
VLECINTSEQESRANYIYCKECGELNTGDWTQVRVSQATKKRVNIPFIADHHVQTSNRYAVLSNLQEPLDILSKSVTSPMKITRVKKKSLVLKKAHHSFNRRQSRKGHIRKINFLFGFFISLYRLC